MSDDLVRRHFAFFSSVTGQWLGELAGWVPRPDLPAAPTKRMRLLAAWQTQVIRGLGTRHAIEAELWSPQFDQVPSAQTTACDVTHFAWPVGDHVWHRFDPIDQRLDWPYGHRFIQVDLTTLEVVAHQHSHRPIRPHANSLLVDVTGTPLEPAWGWIWGRFERCGDRWTFRPQVVRRPNGAEDPLRSVPAPVRGLLETAPVDMFIAQAMRAWHTPQDAALVETVWRS